MNTLSILFYLVDVLYTLTAALSATLFIGWVLYVILMFSGKVWADSDLDYETPETRAAKKKVREMSIIPAKKWFWISGLVTLFLILVPSKDTFYLIVASEAGEAVVSNPEAKEILTDLREILDVQLEKLKQ